MNELEQLEADLAKARTELAEAAVDLAEAQAALANAGTNISKTFSAVRAQADFDKTAADLARARDNCRRASAALSKFNREQMSLRSTRSDEHLVDASEMSTVKTPESGKGTARFTNRLAAQESGVTHAAGWRSLVRPTAMLLALTMSYLQYYFLDVSLQIMQLPSSVVG